MKKKKIFKKQIDFFSHTCWEPKEKSFLYIFFVCVFSDLKLMGVPLNLWEQIGYKY